MSPLKFSLEDFLDHCLAYIRSNGTSNGMKANAAKHFGVDRRTISRWLHEIRRRRRLGRDVYRCWRDSL